MRDVEPGEIVTIGPDGMESLKPFPPAPHAKCIFEYIYFARPDSNLFGHNVYQVRKALGRQLARESGVEADLVTPVPDSGVPAAMGFSEESEDTPGVRADSQPLRRQDVHRTATDDSQLRRARSSSTRSATCCTANASWSWTIRSCAARPAARSFACCATPAPKKCTCASARRRRSALLLRHRYADAIGAHRVVEHRRRYPPLHRGRHARLSEPTTACTRTSTVRKRVSATPASPAIIPFTSKTKATSSSSICSTR